MCNFDRRIGGSTPSSHSWIAPPPLVKDMLHEARIGLTKAVVTGPGSPVLFYGRCSMGEGLTMDEARDAALLITETGTWVGKLAYLATDPMTIQAGRRAIAQAISDHCVKERGPGCPCCESASPTTLPVWSPKKFPSEGCIWGWWFWFVNHHPIGPQKAKNVIDIRGTKGLNHLISPQPSPDCSLSLSTASLMLSRSDRSDGSRHPRRGRWHWEEGACMKINLPIFKDEECQRHSNLSELEVGFNGISTCRVQGSHPPTLCNKIFARLS